MSSKLPLVILCGGQSIRMGQQKHLLEIDGFPLWRMLQLRFEKSGYEVFISCRKDQLTDFEGVETIVDSHEAIGPMGGILSALLYFGNRSVLVLSCDNPCITKHTLYALENSNTPDLIATCATLEHSTNPEPLIAIWNNKALESINHAVFIQDYSLMKLLRNHEIGIVAIPAEEIINMNTPEEWLAFNQRLNKSKRFAPRMKNPSQ